jgi:hypothetical protein
MIVRRSGAIVILQPFREKIMDYSQRNHARTVRIAVAPGDKRKYPAIVYR